MVVKKTKVLLGKEARDTLMKGIDTVYHPVAASIGAQGRNTIYREFGTGYVITNDGVTIARAIRPEEDELAVGADMIKQAAERTNYEAGDGTTTTVILSRELIKNAFDAVDTGENPMQIRKSLIQARDQALDLLKGFVEPVGDRLLQVAKVSVEDEGLAELVSSAVTEAGADGTVDVIEHGDVTTTKDVVSGYFFEQGFISPYMITNPNKAIAELDDPAVFIIDKRLNLNHELVPTIDTMVREGQKRFVLICEDLEGELLNTLIQNKLKGVIEFVAVRKPDMEEMEDIATLLGATAITRDKGISEIKPEHAGKAKRVIVKEDQILIINDKDEATTERISELRDRSQENPEDEQLKKRISKLSSVVVVIRVGAKTDSDRKYIKLKIDDAVCACQAALAEGIVPGAGSTLNLIGLQLENKIMREAFCTPRLKILKNAGIVPSKSTENFDVSTGEVVDNLVEKGIIDPAKVTRCCIENSVSLASVALTTECIAYEVNEEKKGTN